MKGSVIINKYLNADSWRMSLKIILIVMFAVLLEGQSFGYQEEENLDKLRIAFTRNQNLDVLTGNGRTVLTLKARQVGGKFEFGFLEADVSPDQSLVVALECHNYDPDQGPMDGYCEIVEIPLTNILRPTVQVLYSPFKTEIENEFVQLDAPAWSADGQKIAFFQGQKNDRYGEIVIIEAKSGEVFKRIPVPYLRGVQANGNYLRWSRNGKKIFIWATHAKEDKEVTADFNQDIGVIALDSGQVRWLGKWISGPEGNHWERQLFDPESIEAVKALRGPKERNIDNLGRVLPLGYSPNERYFFYYQESSTGPSNFSMGGFIKRYDTFSHIVKSIRTIWWTPYYIE